MSNEIEYIEPTQEHVGQMVEVRDRANQPWKQREFYGIISHPLYKFVAGVDENGTPLPYTFARIPRPLTYAERQARCGLKVGDRVRILTLPESGQDGWKAGVCGSWRHLVGTVHRITNDCKEYGFTVAGWNFPYFVLEKVEDRKAIHDDWGKTVYVDGSPQDEFRLMATHCEVGSDSDSCVWFGVVRNNDKRFVYELSNLRVKE